MRVRDLTGRRFVRWTVIRFVERRNRKTLWLCRCDCGTEKQVLALTLTRSKGASRSCGCLAREESRLRAPSLRHGAACGGEFAREYRIWKNMRSRCLNSRSRDYRRYGGRGIVPCDRWSAFENFLADMGPAPSREHTLDRKNNELGYSPENCRWATQTEQQRNRRNNKLNVDSAAEIRRLIAAGGSLRSVANRFGVSRRLVGEIARGRAWKSPEQPSLFGGSHVL